MSDETISEVTPTETMQRAAALWVLKTQEVCRLPVSTTEKIMEHVQALYDVALTNVQADVLEALKEAQIQPSSIPRLDRIFSQRGPHGDLFQGLDSHYKQIKYYKEHFSFVVSW